MKIKVNAHGGHTTIELPPPHEAGKEELTVVNVGEGTIEIVASPITQLEIQTE